MPGDFAHQIHCVACLALHAACFDPNRSEGCGLWGKAQDGGEEGSWSLGVGVCGTCTLAGGGFLRCGGASPAFSPRLLLLLLVRVRGCLVGMMSGFRSIRDDMRIIGR